MTKYTFEKNLGWRNDAKLPIKNGEREGEVTEWMTSSKNGFPIIVPDQWLDDHKNADQSAYAPLPDGTIGYNIITGEKVTINGN